MPVQQAQRRPVPQSEHDRALERALELDAQAQRRPQGEAVTPDDLERVGREAGIAPEALRQAMAELKAGALPVAPPALSTMDQLVGTGIITLERHVPGPLSMVRSRVHGFMEEQLMRVRRNLGARTTWQREEGLLNNLKRSLDFGGRYIFDQDTVVDVLVMDRLDGSAQPVVVEMRVDGRVERNRFARRVVVRGVVTALATTFTLAALGSLEALLGAPAALLVPLVGGAWMAAAVYRARQALAARREFVASQVEPMLDTLELGRHQD